MHGNCSKLHQGKFKLGVRKHFFMKKVVKHWNSLSEKVFDALSLSVFKRHLDNAVINMLSSCFQTIPEWSGTWTR